MGDHEGLFTAYTFARQKLDEFCDLYVVPESVTLDIFGQPQRTVADAYEELSPTLRAQMMRRRIIPS
jgi:hypothetical protein